MRTKVLALTIFALAVAAGGIPACGDSHAPAKHEPAAEGADDTGDGDMNSMSPATGEGASASMTGSHSAIDAGGAEFDAGRPPALDASHNGGATTTALDGAVSDGSIGSGDTSDASMPPAVIDFGAKGPFDDAKMFSDAGPDGTYVLYRPDTSLGRNGFKHPIGVWGNGLGTTPDQYQELLTLVASHGFVLIGCPDPIAEQPCLSDGLDWLAQQDSASGPLAGKLDTMSEFAIGYSWGGGAAIDVSTRPNIKTTISMHGMPPRNDPWASMHAPLVLFSATGDTLVPADGFVSDNYNSSQVQTFFGVIQDSEVRHMYVMDPDSFSCATGAPEILELGPCMGAIEEQAPVIAWLRYWIYGDQGARSYYFGDDCKLCSGRWSAQRKNWN